MVQRKRLERCLPHLPYHYSRTPSRTWNGELAITADLVRNAEGIRQGVIELRQLMALLRTRGTREFAIVGTSYGGWIGALLSFLEADFRFVALVQPIVNMDKAVWESPGSAVMRRELRSRGHSRGNTARFDHLVSPLHGVPLCGPSSILLTGGLHDRISPSKTSNFFNPAGSAPASFKSRKATLATPPSAKP